MNTNHYITSPRYSEKVIQMMMDGWEKHYGERITSDEAKYHLDRVMELLRLVRSSMKDRGDVGDVVNQ